jgi:hypothetical protein
MIQDDDGVRAALQQLLGRNEKEIELMLGRYAGYSLTVRGFMRRWFEKRFGEHEWMLEFIDIRLIADVAVATGRVVTVPAKRGATLRRGVYVFMVGA